MHRLRYLFVVKLFLISVALMGPDKPLRVVQVLEVDTV